jgi:Holliday junction resolvase
MPSTNYRLGAELERSVAQRLRTKGWLVVRAAGSHGPFDLVALREARSPLLIQCKTDRRTLDAVTWHALFTLALSLDATPIIADRNGPRREATLWVMLGERPKYRQAGEYLSAITWAEL